VNAHEGKAGMVLFAGNTLRFECTTLAKKRHINTLPFLYQTPTRHALLGHQKRTLVSDDNKPGERLLADFELFEQVRQQMAERLVADAALYHVEVVVCLLHDPQPRLVDRLEPLCLLRPSAMDVYIKC